MASWQMRCMKTKIRQKNETKQKTNKKLSIFSFFVFSTNKQECSTETGMEGDVKKQRKDGGDEARERVRERETEEKKNSSISSCSVCV